MIIRLQETQVAVTGVEQPVVESADEAHVRHESGWGRHEFNKCRRRMRKMQKSIVI